MYYNWQQKDWPLFRYSLETQENALLAFAQSTGYISGMLKAIPEVSRIEAVVQTMVSEALKTSEIEGEFFSRHDVISSIRNKMGLNSTAIPVKNKKAGGAGELMVDVRNTFAEPLTAEKLFEWHRLLMKEGHHIAVGAWRKGAEPMQVISGALGKERIHFEAPPSRQVPKEMTRFLRWFNDTAPGGKQEILMAPVRAAIAHLYFESIHPFEDGNGRIGRAIAEKALSQTLGRPVLLSLSLVIEANKTAYYRSLEQAQQRNEISEWIGYFVQTALDAQQKAIEVVEFSLRKSRFFERFDDKLGERQLKAVRKMLDAGPEGFEGGMTAKKYIAITKTSKATATRDLHLLTALGILLPVGGGRSVGYILNI